MRKSQRRQTPPVDGKAHQYTGELFQHLLNEVGWAGLKDGKRI